MALTATTTSLPARRVATMRFATRLMLSASATEEPPYFWTISATWYSRGCRAARVWWWVSGGERMPRQSSILRTPPFPARHVTGPSTPLYRAHEQEDTGPRSLVLGPGGERKVLPCLHSWMSTRGSSE